MIPVSPLLSYPLFLGSGIVAGWYGGLGKNYAYLLLPLFVIIIILLVRRRKTPLLGIVFFLTLGAFLGAREQQRRVINYEVASSYRDQEITVIGTVVSTPSPWRKGSRFILRVESLNDELLELNPKWEIFLHSPQEYNYGQRLEIAGNPFGEASQVVTTWTREGVTSGLLAKGKPLLRGEGKTNLFLRFSNRLRHRLLAVGEQTLPEEAAILLHGMLLGRIEEQLSRDQFERAGIAHLLSVSGLHLLFWLGLFWGLGKIVHLPDWLLAVLALPVIVLFILMAGGKAPAMRAGIMTLLALFGELSRRRTEGPLLLAAAACVIMMIRPLEIFSQGFWLSFSACVGLIVLSPKWEKSFQHHPFFVWLQPFLLSFFAYLMVLPLIARFYGGVSLVAPLANVILVPLAGIAVQIGLLASLLGLVYLPLAQLLNAGNKLIILLFRVILTFFTKLPGYVSFPPWPWMVVVAIYAVIALLTWGVEVNPINKKRRIPLFYILLTIGLLSLIITGSCLFQETQFKLKIVFFDVGQGDAILVTTPGGAQILIDGGDAKGYNQEIKPYFKEQGIHRLDLLVVTHAHEDHLGGIVRLIEDKRVKIEKVLDSGMPHTTQLYQKFLELVLDNEITYLQGVRGTQLRVGDVKGLVLNPPPTYLRGTGSDVNNNSVVLLLDCNSIRLLFVGDAEQAGEEEMLAFYHDALRAQLLKVGHHGSETGTGAEWLEKIKPEIAVISVGANNPYGHPAAEVLTRLKAIAKVYRTDQDGRLTFYLKTSRFGRRTKIQVERGVQ
jgi:competence protein ComEC